jgi:hypothetical protein
LEFNIGELTKRTFDYKTIMGPSFLNGLPDNDEWQKFKKYINHEQTLALTELWFEKASKTNGVPLREDFSFDEFVQYGSNIYIAKLKEDNRWHTTFCGGSLVDVLGFDATGKCLDEFATPETLKFWVDNLNIMVEQETVYLEFYSLELTNNEISHSLTISLPLKSDTDSISDTSLTHEVFTSENLFPDSLE